eukprot:PLAT8338.1.p1 GENE.PLAT8338.1~~PLAT8338.1.p1  ORF type:complete len:179 (-),score=53.83 PLAT8338.1:23-559(-)
MECGPVGKITVSLVEEEDAAEDGAAAVTDEKEAEGAGSGSVDDTRTEVAEGDGLEEKDSQDWEVGSRGRATGSVADADELADGAGLLDDTEKDAAATLLPATATATGVYIASVLEEVYDLRVELELKERRILELEHKLAEAERSHRVLQSKHKAVLADLLAGGDAADWAATSRSRRRS